MYWRWFVLNCTRTYCIRAIEVIFYPWFWNGGHSPRTFLALPSRRTGYCSDGGLESPLRRFDSDTIAEKQSSKAPARSRSPADVPAHCVARACDCRGHTHIRSRDRSPTSRGGSLALAFPRGVAETTTYTRVSGPFHTHPAPPPRRQTGQPNLQTQLEDPRTHLIPISDLTRFTVDAAA